MIDKRAVGMIGANCYLFVCDETKKAVLIDPGAEGQKLYRWVTEKGVEVEYILITHGHADHIEAVDELRDLLGAKVAIHSADAEMLTDGEKNLSGLLGKSLAYKPADILLKDGDVLTVGKESITVIATPGHSQGCVCFLTREALFSGDTLFAGSIGRTDFPGGSLEQLLRGVREKLLSLPVETRVLPGHQEETTIGREKASNPFLR
ncbi:MAG: MBL fold metallo-hydrolase [Desulfitobacteriaceae bacterium]